MEEKAGGHWFEWDDNKNKINVRKHGISFHTAKYVFNDENRLEFYDESHSVNEERYITIGMVHEVLFVVYTERKNSTRLISARKANEKERRIYYGNY